MSRWLVVGLCAVVLSGTAAQQKPAEPRYAAVSSIPSDRSEASYAIYSQLLPGHQIEWGDVSRTQWLMEAATKAVPLDDSCTTGGMLNPHTSVRPPAERQSEFAEVLADFDAHCHDRYVLEASRFHLKVPVHILDDEAQKRFVQGVMHYMPPENDIMRAPATPDEFKGAAGMHSFTAVYFNRAHMLAMTEIGMYCGGLCGNWSWVVLERRDGAWHVLPWRVVTAIS
jgi:hypothetical protein